MAFIGRQQRARGLSRQDTPGINHAHTHPTRGRPAALLLLSATPVRAETYAAQAEREAEYLRGAINLPKPPATPPKVIKKVRVCVFDPIGAHGPLANAAKDVRLETLKWGYDLDLIPFTNEKIVAEDFKAGRCDAAIMSGLRARLFNTFAGTVDSIGGLTTEGHHRLMAEVLASPKISPKMRAGEFESLGAIPIGPAYVFTNDKTVNSLTKAAGKRVAVLDYDPVQARMVTQVGASPVGVEITNVAGKFNNGTVDIIAAPLAAVEALELWKGLQPNGGIIDYPIVWPTVQALVRTKDFPPEIGIAARWTVHANFDLLLKYIRQAEGTVAQKYFIQIPDADKVKYEEMMRQARISLRNEGYYDGEMLGIQRKIRCRVDPSRAECTDKTE